MILDFRIFNNIKDRDEYMNNWNEFIKLYNSFQYEEIEKLHGTIYHYTSPEGLKGIFDTSSLFASDMYFLNDSSEGMYVISLIEENIDRLCKSENELKRYVEKELRLIKSGKWQEQIHNYIISFSQNGDSLEMWNYYTKGNSIQGYNIGFDIDKLSSCIQIEILDDNGGQIPRDNEKHLVLYQGKVIYDKDKQVSIVESIFDKFYRKYIELSDKEMLSLVAHFIVSKIINYGMFFKSKEFSIEEEYRFIYATYLLKNNSEKGIPYKEQFRIHDGCLVPYQKCLFDMKSVSEVTFSPSLYNEMTEAGLKRLLDQCGIMHENRIKKSKIPLRY